MTMQVTEARAALKAADAALTGAKAECEAADERRRELAAELTLAQGALQGGSPGSSAAGILMFAPGSWTCDAGA
jgi:hypothetical protein